MPLPSPHRSEEIKLDGRLNILRDLLYVEADGACAWKQSEVDVNDNERVYPEDEEDAAEYAMPARMIIAEEQKIEAEEEVKDENIDRIVEEMHSESSNKSDSEP